MDDGAMAAEVGVDVRHSQANRMALVALARAVDGADRAEEDWTTSWPAGWMRRRRRCS